MNSSSPELQTSRSRSYVVVFVGMILQNFLLFGLSVIIASLFGTDANMDAFRTAFAPPVVLATVLAGTGGPLLTALLVRQQEQGRQTAALLFLFLIFLSIVLAGAGLLFDKSVLKFLHPWFDEQRQQESLRLFRILVLMLPLNATIGLSHFYLNSFLNFATPALSGIVGPMVTIGLVKWLGPQWGIDGVAWATVWGAVVSVVCLLPGILKRFSWPDAGALPLAFEQLGIAWPLLLGMVMVKADPLVDQSLGSSLPVGQISQLDYAMRILTPMFVLSSGTLSTVTFPRIARTALEGGEALRAEARFAFRTLITLLMPTFVVLTVFAEPLIRDVLQRDQFTAADTAAVAGLVRILSCMMLGMAVAEVCSKMLYGLRDSLTPNLILGGCLLVGFGLKLLCVQPLGIRGIAMVTSLTGIAIGCWQLAVVCSRVGVGPTRSGLLHSLRCLVASLGAAVAGWWALSWPVLLPSIWGLVLGGVVYACVLLLLDSQTREFIDRLRKSRLPN